MVLSQSFSSHSVHSADYITYGPGSYRGLHALVPLIIGFAVPFAVIAIPLSMMMDASLTLPLLGLLPLLAISTIAFFVSIFAAGPITWASFDPHTRTAEFIRLGTFANTSLQVPFSEIAAVRMAISYDAAGSKVLQPQVELVSGKRLELPSETTWNDIDVIRHILSGNSSSGLEAWSRKRDLASRQRLGRRQRH